MNASEKLLADFETAFGVVDQAFGPPSPKKELPTHNCKACDCPLKDNYGEMCPSCKRKIVMPDLDVHEEEFKERERRSERSERNIRSYEYPSKAKYY